MCIRDRAKAGAGGVQRVVKAHAVFISQEPDQFWPGNRRVGVVHLDGDVFWQVTQIGMRILEAAQDVLERGRDCLLYTSRCV